MFNLMDNISTIELTGAPEQVILPVSYMWVWARNDGSETVYMSRSSTVSSGANGSISIPAGGAARLFVNGYTFYVNGSGTVLINATDTDSCPFRDAPATSGGGTVDCYTKSESDARYAQKTDIPSSLPANGGNAATVGGVGIANLRQITQTVINTLPAVPNGEGDFFVICDESDTSFPYEYGHLSIRYGSYTEEYVAIFRTAGNDNKVYYNTYRTNHWSGWQEISTTPIKSETMNVSTDSSGNAVIFEASENKKIISINCFAKQAVPFNYNNKQYGHFTENDGSPYSGSVSFTVYYIIEG